MQAIQDFFFIILLLSLRSLPDHFLQAKNIPNIQNPDQGLRGNDIDYESLLAIKSEISNDPDSVLSSWNNSLHFCQWEGVTCGHKHRRVAILDLSSSKLVGTLSPYIGNLSFLHQLHLYNNSFKGNIPHQISHLPRLRELDLGINSFEGEIPANLSCCLRLRILYLSYNKLEGRIPSELATLPELVEIHLATNNLSGNLQAIAIGNLSSSFRKLILDQNHLEGHIPYDIGRLKSLEGLSLGDNMLSGTIPSSLFNLSRLQDLYLSRNHINGKLPQDIDQLLPRLRYLYISHAFLIGQVPVSLSNLTQLEKLDISFNNFSGRFSFNGNKLPHLFALDIESSFLPGGEARDLSFLSTLTNCSNLTYLMLGANSFTGIFPRSILNFSTSLSALVLGRNQITSQLPLGLSKFVNLRFLDLGDNYFIGSIPSDISKLESLEILSLSSNYFSGEIPSSLANLTKLSVLDGQNNNLQGPVPESLGNNKNLEKLELTSNKLSGGLPVELFNASSLIYVSIGQNNLQGSIPVDISQLRNLFMLDVSENRFSGEIPSTLGDCTSLTILDMSKNSFIGSIPMSLSSLKSIKTLDLSCNNLSGQIPGFFSTWQYLVSLNLSYNNLEGKVPTNGVFANTSVVVVIGNPKLCGGVLELHLQKCPSTKESKRRRLSIALFMIISVACGLIVALSLALCLNMLCSSKKRKDASSRMQNVNPFLEVSYQILSRATNGFSPSNLLGVGGFGFVYKGILHQDDTEIEVAVKVLNLQNQGAAKSFVAECKALNNIRHRNLVKIITICSSIDAQRNDFKALVYEYMSRGSLDIWFHSNPVNNREQAVDNQPSSLSLFQRLNIAIDVASALEYLHIGCTNPIVHCDLKPTNILLDEDMTAHVADFGLAKFHLGASASNHTNQTSSTQVRGTVGYAAPEYGLGSKASPEGDIYSFGIIVLEMMTSKRPTDPMFKDGLNLHEFSKSALPDQVMEIIDQRMLGDASLLPARSNGDVRKIECIKSLIMVGVQCSLAVPHERMSISNALNELKSARQNILSRGPRNQITT